MKTYESNMDQLELLMVKEDEKRVPAKRVDIVSLRLVKETSLLYKESSGAQSLTQLGNYSDSDY